MPNFTIGLDLGQRRDYSAAVVTERVQQLVDSSGLGFRPPDHAYLCDERVVVDTYHVRHIQRWPLGTPYGTVVDDTAELMRTPEFRGHAVLLFDATGVGGAVGDMFTKAYRAGRMGKHRPRPVTLTGGFSRDLPPGGRGSSGAIHKGDLVSRLVALSESGRVKLPLGLPLADVLESELRAFTLKQTKAGALAFEAKRESDHDDLVIALALSVWHRHNRAEPRYLSPAGELLEK
ncbi:MAG: hypothetical protein GX624_04810 [Actinobacteria bacterium]|nr:hypothetical protein [Actinomycetota bacterium]